ncbi:MAG: pyridoxal-phosphate dependent enzyme [Candidatus Micrarchaeaceae archaeon]
MLEVEYKFTNELFMDMPQSFWGYSDILPSSRSYKKYSVGLTKLLKSNSEEKLFLKFEFQNPTGSFKDRGSVIEIAKANDYNYKKVVCASTGNMAYSIAYYAKFYGIKATVYVSMNANKDKIYNIKKTGNAEIIKVNGDFTTAQKLAEKHAFKKKEFITGDYCYRKEGQKTIIYEILAQQRNTRNIIVPIGNATLFSGMLKSLKEIKDNYPKTHLPKLIGVQSATCKPLYTAYKNKSVLRYEMPKTNADAIAVGYPTFGVQALEYMKELDSDIVTVTETEMKNEQKIFYKDYGLEIELAGVAPIAAYKKLNLYDNETVVVLTGKNV